MMSVTLKILLLATLNSRRAGDAVSTTDKQLCEETLDVAFIVDTSGSVKDADFIIMKDFIANVIRRFNITQDTVRVSALTFARGVTIGFKLNEINSTDEAIAAVGNLIRHKYPGSTWTHEGLSAARTVLFQPHNGDRVKVPNVAIVITDGRSTYPNQTASEAIELRDLAVEVFAVGVGNFSPTELEAIASSPYDYYEGGSKIKTPTTSTTTTTTPTTTTTTSTATSSSGIGRNGFKGQTLACIAGYFLCAYILLKFTI